MALYPDVDMPMVTATVNYEGASARALETEVTEVLEESLATISGVKSMRSETREGVSQVFLEFDLERDVNIAAQDVRDKVSSAQYLLPATPMPRSLRSSIRTLLRSWALSWPATPRSASYRNTPTT